MLPQHAAATPYPVNILRGSDWDIEGAVKVYGINTSAFDRFTRNPNAATRADVRERYWRLVVFAPYFDRRLSWFPDALLHRNLYGISRNSDLAREHPEWILRDRRGNKLYIPYACRNGTCPRYAGDFSNPAFRRHWIARARSLVEEGYAGFWIDDVNMYPRSSNGAGKQIMPWDSTRGREWTSVDWRRELSEFTKKIRDDLPNYEMIHNVIWFATGVDDDDPYVERQLRSADLVQLERGINDRGLRAGSGRFGLETFFRYVDLLHSYDRKAMFRDDGENPTEYEYGLAGHLLVNEGQDLYSITDLSASSPDSWWPGLDVDLRRSEGRRYAWRGLIRRDFECGVVLLNQPRRNSITVRMDRRYNRIGGGTSRTVTLRGSEGAVLITPGCR